MSSIQFETKSWYQIFQLTLYHAAWRQSGQRRSLPASQEVQPATTSLLLPQQQPQRTLFASTISVVGTAAPLTWLHSVLHGTAETPLDDGKCVSLQQCTFSCYNPLQVHETTRAQIPPKWKGKDPNPTCHGRQLESSPPPWDRVSAKRWGHQRRGSWKPCSKGGGANQAVRIVPQHCSLSQDRFCPAPVPWQAPRVSGPVYQARVAHRAHIFLLDRPHLL